MVNSSIEDLRLMGARSNSAAWARITVVAAGIAAASLLHFLTPPSLLLWHQLFQRLYYLPIVFAAIYFGWRGGLAASLLSSLLYIPHIFTAWHHMPDYAMNQYAELIVFFLVGGVTGVLADRERKRREELQAATNQLAKVYRDLQASFEQLKRADRLSAIGQLSANLAHEIRNPLASIEGAAGIIEQPGISEDMRQEFVGVIRKESRRLNRLLTNLLDFARPRPPAFQNVNAARLVDSVITLIAPTVERDGITLSRRALDPAPVVRSDPEQLKQVVLNLTINAVQAMPHGGEIELAASQSNGDVVISVTDHGPGIPAEDLDRIFDPFFTTKENGTGLGLSVAHQIVTQHGGSIAARRNPGGGMTFSITLPAAVDNVSQESSVAQEPHSGS